MVMEQNRPNLEVLHIPGLGLILQFDFIYKKEYRIKKLLNITVVVGDKERFGPVTELIVEMFVFAAFYSLAFILANLNQTRAKRKLVKSIH